MLDWTRHAFAGAALVICGCSASAPEPERPERDGGAPGTRAAGAADAGAADAATDAGPAPASATPPNDSFETARPIAFGPAPLQDIKQPGQVDYYSFEGEAGAFYALSTEQGPFTPNTVIALFDPDQRLLAENDDGSIWPGDRLDSRLVVRLTRSGTYFVRVQNHVSADPVTPPVFYHLTLRRLASDEEGIGFLEADDPLPVRLAHDGLDGFAYATLVGDFETARNAVFEFEGEGDHVLVGHVLPTGPSGSGSTAKIGVVRVADGDDLVLSAIDGAKGQHEFHPPLHEGAYYRVNVELDGDAGENGFFAIDLAMLSDNPRERAEEDNGALEGAESLELRQESSRRRGLLLASLGVSDIDYYRFEAPTNATVTVVCEGASGGSGVQGLHAEVRDGSDQTLTAADETSEANLLIQDFALIEPGTYYLRLSRAIDSSADAIQPWVRCAVIARP